MSFWWVIWEPSKPGRCFRKRKLSVMCGMNGRVGNNWGTVQIRIVMVAKRMGERCL